MEMTFDQYISNPMGIKNAVYSNRDVYRNLYTEKLDKILVREAGRVKYDLYISKDGRYFVHMKVPSEVIEKFYYDTVIEFYTNDNAVKLTRTLSNYFVKFYSNDPSFVFTFAHAMLSNDMFVRDLVPRMSKEAVKNIASEKNPKNEIGYVKSIYFTYLLMKNYNLFSKITYETTSNSYNRKDLLDNVEHADNKVSARQSAEHTVKKQEKIERKKNGGQDSRSITNPVARVSNVVTSKIAGSGKKVNTVKKTSFAKKI
jgi:hypothetical protein